MTDPDCGIAGPDELRQLNQAHPTRYPFLLQSTTRGGQLGRYDILFACPGESMRLDEPGEDSDFLKSLDQWWQAERQDLPESDLPFRGGWFLYLGYELAGEIEPRLQPHKDPLLPAAFAVRCRAAMIYDHDTDCCHFICEEGADFCAAQLRDDVSKLGDSDLILNDPIVRSVREDSAIRFTDAVNRAKQYIEAGDVYQANLSRQWLVTVSDDTSAERIYRSLCTANPAPFAGIARWEGTAII